MIKNTLKTNENMKALESVILNNATLKSELQGGCNVNIDVTNKVATLFGALPNKRVEMWLDSRNVVIFVGASIHDTTEKSETYTTLFNDSLDVKYRISDKIETKHKFESVELASQFLTALSQRIVVESETETATETVETAKKQTATNKSQSKKSQSKKASTKSQKKVSKTA